MSAALYALEQTVTASGGTVLSGERALQNIADAGVNDARRYFAAAAAEDDEFSFDSDKAEKLAGNHGFLKGFMARVRNFVLGNDPKNMSTARKVAIGSSILFAATALRLAATQPQKFGYMASTTAKMFGAWVVEMGKFVVDVCKTVGGWLLRRFQSLLRYLQSLRGPLAAAATRGAHRTGQSMQHFASGLNR